MIDSQNALEAINEIAVLPLVIITFVILMYVVVFLWKKDPDFIRARIFLKYSQFKKAFLLLSIFAFVLILHVGLIYDPHLFYFILNCTSSFAYDIQRFLGLILALIMLTFAYIIHRNIK